MNLLKRAFSRGRLCVTVPACLAALLLIGLPFFFYLRFLILFTVMLLILTALFFALRITNRRRCRILSAAVLVLGLVFLLYFTSVQVRITAHDRGNVQGATAPNCLIVFGCQVKGDEPSAMLEQRLRAALEYLQRVPDSVAVLTGYHGTKDRLSEAECMYRWLTDRGIDPSRLIRDERSANTAENVVNSLALLRERDETIRSVAVVSTGFHLYRIETLCQRENVAVTCVAAEIPGSIFFRANSYIREFCSITFMYVREILT